MLELWKTLMAQWNKKQTTATLSEMSGISLVDFFLAVHESYAVTLYKRGQHKMTQQED